MNRRVIVLICAGMLVAVALTFYGSWQFPLLDPDEARYAEASREMIEQKSYIVPQFNYEPRLNKPILFYWLQIISYSIFGINEFSARFPSMLAGLGCILLILFLNRFFSGEVSIVLPLFIFITNPFYAAFSRSGLLEIVLLFFFTLSMLLFLKGEESAQKGNDVMSSIYIALFFLALGLAFLTKGPVAVIVPLFIIFIYLLFVRRLSPFSLKRILTGIVLCVGVTAPWGIALIVKVGLKNITSLVRHETVERYFVGFDHPEPFYFYVPLFFVAFLPWSSFIPAGIYRKIARSLQRKDEKDLFLLIWLIFPVIFFSFSGSKLPGYILSVLPPAAIIVATEWKNILGSRREFRRAAEENSSRNETSGRTAGNGRWFFLTSVGIMLVLLLFCFFEGHALLHRYPDFTKFYFLALFLSIPFIVLFVFFAVTGRGAHLFLSMMVYALLFLVSIMIFAMPRVEGMKSTRDLVRGYITQYMDYTIVSYRYLPPSLVFYLERKVKHAGSEQELAQLACESEKLLVVTSEKNYEELTPDVLRLFKVERKEGKFMLLVLRLQDRP